MCVFMDVEVVVCSRMDNYEVQSVIPGEGINLLMREVYQSF